jgi:hypothetical protein
MGNGWYQIVNFVCDLFHIDIPFVYIFNEPDDIFISGFWLEFVFAVNWGKLIDEPSNIFNLFMQECWVILLT